MDPDIVKIGSAVAGVLVILSLIGDLIQDTGFLVRLAILVICGLAYLWAEKQERPNGGS